MNSQSDVTGAKITSLLSFNQSQCPMKCSAMGRGDAELHVIGYRANHKGHNL